MNERIGLSMVGVIKCLEFRLRIFKVILVLLLYI